MDAVCIAEKNSPGVAYTISVATTQEEIQRLHTPQRGYREAFYLPGTERVVGSMSFTSTGGLTPNLIVHVAVDTAAIVGLRNKTDAEVWVKRCLEEFLRSHH